MELLLSFWFPRLLHVHDLNEAFQSCGLLLELLDPGVQERVGQPMLVPLH